MEGFLMSFSGLPRSVTTITPQRISFVGGGTDLPAFFNEQDGGVISSTINQFVYVTVKRHSALFEENYRLSYSITEHTNNLDEIKNGIARECLRLLNVEPPLYIATAADLPAGSGLGSSSSFAVGLLHALHLIKGDRVSPAQLAEEACEVEINKLGNPIGKQDQYAAAFGGLNHFTFQTSGRVIIDPMVLPDDLINTLFTNSLLIWSGVQRDASVVLKKQNQKLGLQLNKYEKLIRDVEECKNILLASNLEFLESFSRLIEKTWATKKSLEDSISTSAINDLHNQIKEFGGYGGKLCGAGGGGFLFEIVPEELHKKVFALFGAGSLINIAYEPLGSRLLSQVY